MESYVITGFMPSVYDNHLAEKDFSLWWLSYKDGKKTCGGG